MVTIGLVVAAAAVVLALSALWPPRWAPLAWRRSTRRLRHRVRRERYRSIDLDTPPRITGSINSEHDRPKWSPGT